MQQTHAKLSVYALPKSVRWESGNLYLLDQTQLPLDIVEERQDTIRQVWEAINQLKIRGAPAIGIAGAYGLLLGMKDRVNEPVDTFLRELRRQVAYLESARPTAVNLRWALKRMVHKAQDLKLHDSKKIYKGLVKEAIQIHNEDKRLCRQIGENGATLIKERMGVLTHCNAGSLAVSELGTALAPMYIAHSQGIKFHIYADETRPLLQGSRLTSWELHKAGLDVTLICDNMAAHIMSQGLVDLIIVGADRVAANGDVANKIGTMGIAILAKHFSIPFYVACPHSTIDFDTPKGENIVIEERGEEEITHVGSHRVAPEGIKVRNPAFDVTPYQLITGLITERGIIHPLNEITLRATFNPDDYQR